MFCGGRDKSRPLRATTLVTLSVQLFPLETIESSIWWDLQWTIPIAVGRWEAFSMAIIWFALVTDPPFVVSNPHSFQIAVWDRRI